MKFYVYVRFRPNGVPCYVGKGTGNRAVTSAKRYWHNLELVQIASEADRELPCVIVRDNLTEEEAFIIEKALIKSVGCKGSGPLVNKKSGGQGASGHKRPDLSARNKSAEHRAAVRRRQSGIPRSDAVKEKLRLANLGKKASEVTRKKMSLARVGRPVHDKNGRLAIKDRQTGSSNSFAGRKHSEETRSTMSASQKGVSASHSEEKKREMSSKQSAALRGGTRPPETPETKLKKSVSAKARHAAERSRRSTM